MPTPADDRHPPHPPPLPAASAASAASGRCRLITAAGWCATVRLLPKHALPCAPANKCR